MKTLLDDAGRIQLPDFVQAQLGVKPGDELALEEENGKWLIKAASLTSAGSPTAANGEDLSWENLDYEPVPLEGPRQVTIKIERRGRLQPPAHDLDEE